jgi:hypothetical protein
MIAQETAQEITQETVLKLLSDHILDPDTQPNEGIGASIPDLARVAGSLRLY